MARSSRSFAFALGLLILLAAGGGTAYALYLHLSGSEKPVQDPGTAYVEGVVGNWQRINPLFASANEADADLSRLIFSGLIRIGPDGSPQPDLAELPQVSDGGRTYTFRLRKDLKWHDGVPLTSHDVAFTIDRLRDGDFRGDPALAEGWQGVDVELPNDSSIVFHLKQPSAPFVARNATIGILPEHLLSGMSAGDLYGAAFNAHPVGSGPYRLIAISSREAVLDAYAGYHFGQPPINHFRLRFFVDYPEASHSMITGELNGLLFRDALTADQAAAVAQIKGVKIDHLQRDLSITLFLNNENAALFLDDRVRKALSLAIDRHAIVDQVVPGVASASSSPVAPGSWAYDGRYETTSPDLVQARTLLEQAGWALSPTTGILVKEGAEFRFTLRTDSDPTRVAIAGEVAKQLEPLGIRATVASTSFSVLRRDFLVERKYDAAILAWDQGPDPDPYFGWHSSQTGAAGLNLANYADIVADSLISQGRTATNIDVRKDSYQQFQEIWDETTPSLVLLYPQYIYVHTSKLEGFRPGVLNTFADRFSDVVRWKI